MGTVQSGNIYYRAEVSPLYLNQDPTYSLAQELSVDTGETDESKVGVIQLENGQQWQNNYYYVWDGLNFY